MPWSPHRCRATRPGVRPCRRGAPRTDAMRPPQPADGAPPPRAGTLQRLPEAANHRLFIDKFSC
ncbi:hypothetical protein MYA_4607 [Burkholderia sp. KJ006]|nr:hypothetical protein MYA_4607 [Burkholderia sp. KJ006]